MEISSPMALISQLRQAMDTFPDTRKGKNSRYEISDAGMGAFGVFFTQSPSFLDYQRRMQAAVGRNNANSLFTCTSIPKDKQIRELLDAVPPSSVFPVFQWCFTQMISSKQLSFFKSNLGYLIALDGTGYFSSESIHCDNCLTQTEKRTGRVTYYHTALTPVIVKPGEEHVFSLTPEFILPQDGEVKQDCENKACKRWLERHGKTYATIEEGTAATILGDDLYSRQPVIETILAQGLHFILVAKRESHKWLYEWLDQLDEGDKEDQIKKLSLNKWNGKSHIKTTYRYVNHVPLKDNKDSLWINWAEVIIQNEETGRLIYHNTFATDHSITKENVALIVLAGRARWKIENENNNTLKTKGYHFGHNYGHGQKHLSSLLATLILIAFMFHTILDILWKPYRYLREKLTRFTLFESIRTLTQFFYCSAWIDIFVFIRRRLEEGLLPLPAEPFSALPGG